MMSSIPIFAYQEIFLQRPKLNRIKSKFIDAFATVQRRLVTENVTRGDSEVQILVGALD